jgi:hypothetical protein
MPRTSRVTSLALLLSLLALAGCRCDYVKVEAPPANCQEDLDCFIERARTCTQASLTHRSPSGDAGTPTVMRYELVGRVRGRCHLRRTQLEPALSPIAETLEETQHRYYQPNPAKRHPELLQCLYSEEQAVEALQHLRQGGLTPADLELCYPGDGSCGKVPLLAPGCVLGDCLLGRWTFTCEDKYGKNIQRCEGTRLSDARIYCFSVCKDGKEVLDCRPGH